MVSRGVEEFTRDMPPGTWEQYGRRVLAWERTLKDRFLVNEVRIELHDPREPLERCRCTVKIWKSGWGSGRWDQVGVVLRQVRFGCYEDVIERLWQAFLTTGN